MAYARLGDQVYGFWLAHTDFMNNMSFPSGR